MLTIAVITISDRGFKGEYPDKSGPAIISLLKNAKVECDVTGELISDDKELIKKTLAKHLNKDYIFTTGGTGISSRDVTPEVTSSMCERELPGVSDYLRTESLKETPFAVFSRAFCGIKGNTIIVNFPGSVKAVTLCTRLMIPLLEHGKAMLSGKGHE
ncbi:MAG: MogA/MoaB family molybdenum cofactor biosynthesis protein [Spirochaetales bacterium]|nr:MogA/MoaB family molybdenum cofactor biosynthesis protein [Spirochaetales bacterium]